MAKWSSHLSAMERVFWWRDGPLRWSRLPASDREFEEITFIGSYTGRRSRTWVTLTCPPPSPNPNPTPHYSGAPTPSPGWQGPPATLRNSLQSSNSPRVPTHSRGGSSGACVSMYYWDNFLDNKSYIARDKMSQPMYLVHS